MEEKVADDDNKRRGIYSYDEAVELTGHGLYNYLLLAACCIICNAFALDMFGTATVVAASSCDLQMGLQEIGILVSAPFAGVLFAFPWGYYADTRGRRRALLLSTTVGFLFAAVSSLAPSWQFMLVAKLLGCSFIAAKLPVSLYFTGFISMSRDAMPPDVLMFLFSSTASFTLSMTILGECTGAQHRSQFLQIMNSFNLASEIVSFGLAYFILPLKFDIPVPWLGITYRPWRLYALIMAAAMGIGAGFMVFLFESPKYLASRQEFEKALEVLNRIYTINGGKKDGYPVKHILTSDSEIPNSMTFWGSIAQHTVPIFKPPLLWRTLQLYYLISLSCSLNNVLAVWFPTMVNFFFNSFEAQTAQLSPQNFCDRMYSQIFISNLAPDNSTYQCNDTIATNTIYSGIMYGLFYFLLNLLVSKFASRPRLILVLTLALSAVSSMLVNLYDPIVNMVFFVLVQCTCIGIGCVATYFVDLYPTSHRGLVTSLGMMVARLVSFMGVNIIGVVITSHCEMTFYVLALFAISGVVVSLFLPSDKKMKLDESP